MNKYCAYTNKNDGSFTMVKCKENNPITPDINHVVYDDGMYYDFDLTNINLELQRLKEDINNKYEPFLQQLLFVLTAIKNGAPLILDTTIMPAEVELNRKWLYENKDDDPIGETNFVVTELFVKQHYKNCPSVNEDDTYENFLEEYEPETDGEYLYKLAKKTKCLIQDIGKVYY